MNTIHCNLLGEAQITLHIVVNYLISMTEIHCWKSLLLFRDLVYIEESVCPKLLFGFRQMKKVVGRNRFELSPYISVYTSALSTVYYYSLQHTFV